MYKISTNKQKRINKQKIFEKKKSAWWCVCHLINKYEIIWRVVYITKTRTYVRTTIYTCITIFFTKTGGGRRMGKNTRKNLWRAKKNCRMFSGGDNNNDNIVIIYIRSGMAFIHNRQERERVGALSFLGFLNRETMVIFLWIKTNVFSLKWHYSWRKKRRRRF